MQLPESIKQRVRVHMGVPVMGVQDSGFALGYRFTNVMGLLEFRLNNLQPYEYASIVGLPAAGGTFQGSPIAGQTVTVTVNGVPYVYMIQSSDVNTTSTYGPVFAVASNIANFLTQALSGAFTVSAQPSATYPLSATTVGTLQPYWQLILVSNLGTTFTWSITSSNGAFYGVALNQGTQPRPYYTFTDDNYTANGYIGMCDYLESKTGAASDLSSKYSVADVVTFRRDELSARDDNYHYWRQRLADYLGIPLFPMQPVGGFGGANTGLTI